MHVIVCIGKTPQGLVQQTLHNPNMLLVKRKPIIIDMEKLSRERHLLLRSIYVITLECQCLGKVSKTSTMGKSSTQSSLHFAAVSPQHGKLCFLTDLTLKEEKKEERQVCQGLFVAVISRNRK